MKNYLKMVLLILLVLTLSIGILSAENTKKKESKFKINFSERFRFVGWDNAINLDGNANDGYSFTRHRTSLMAKWFPHHDMEFGIKLTNEFRKYFAPKSIDFNFHEVVFDQLYFKWNNPGKLPLTLTLGRQNIILGEGFVVLEGHPLDGSRTIYFNAVRLDYHFNKKNKLTAFISYQPDTDNMLPVISGNNVPDQSLIEQPMQGLGLYYTGAINNVGLEAYYLRKDVRDTDERPVEEAINTLGARLKLPLISKKLDFTCEGAYQFGTRGEEDRNAFGGYFHLDYSFCDKTPWLKTFTLGGIFLSGDDPATAKVEGWDPVFSRWPKWSESYIYVLIRENGVANWSNLNSIYLSLSTELTERMNLKLTWHRLGAFEHSTGDFPGGMGKTRGNLFISRLDFKINKYFAGHFVWEHFKPGDFYFSQAANMNWLRFELMLNI